ncbi:cupin domain-containing protein [Halonotius terrestris]|uniref:Cupin domain-containing protein n=1 Tax=Halonotius terrestris TaxID=2487750 RepID=A0A8J8PDM2_9EURY|nr:cupin domain-containing protein [Halonotius terrestris]TQQ83108.1 cupin domain-containing protein [Halonotius terrestris]
MRRVNADDMEWTTITNDDTEIKRKHLGEAAGGDQLGCSLYELPAGKRSWPYHYHTANEEAIFVVSGEGTVRCDGEEAAISEGDFLDFPADASGAHRVINDSDGPLRYLAVSTMTEPDVTVYPDSEKFGVYVGSPPGGREERDLEGYYERDANVDYWQDES